MYESVGKANFPSARDLAISFPVSLPSPSGHGRRGGTVGSAFL